jgi:hypothetical protein
MVLTHIAIRALRDLPLGIRCESLERVKWHDTPFGSSLGSPGTSGAFFCPCVSAGPELGGKCGVGRPQPTLKRKAPAC